MKIIKNKYFLKTRAPLIAIVWPTITFYPPILCALFSYIPPATLVHPFEPHKVQILQCLYIISIVGDHVLVTGNVLKFLVASLCREILNFIHSKGIMKAFLHNNIIIIHTYGVHVHTYNNIMQTAYIMSWYCACVPKPETLLTFYQIIDCITPFFSFSLVDTFCFFCLPYMLLYSWQQLDQYSKIIQLLLYCAFA